MGPFQTINLLYVWLLPCWIIKVENLRDIEILIKEIAIRINAGIYKAPNLSEIDFTISHETIVSKLSNKYEKLILMGDFNITTSNQFFGYFCFFTVKDRCNLFQEFKNPKLHRSLAHKFQT